MKKNSILLGSLVLIAFAAGYLVSHRVYKTDGSHTSKSVLEMKLSIAKLDGTHSEILSEIRPSIADQTGTDGVPSVLISGEEGHSVIPAGTYTLAEILDIMCADKNHSWRWVFPENRIYVAPTGQSLNQF